MRKKSRKLKLSIIVPVYNEEKTLLPLLKKVFSTPLPGLTKEILIVDDGSTDGTRLLLDRVKKDGVKILRHVRNKGKGAAIRTAMPYVKGDFVLIQDADLEYDPADYGKLLAPLMKGQADVVYGSRFTGPNRVFMFWNLVANKVLNLATNLLYNSCLTDVETGYKVFKGDLFRGLKLKANGFDFDPEISAQILRKGWRIYETPISYHARSYEEGKKITWRDGFTAFYCLLKHRFLHK